MKDYLAGWSGALLTETTWRRAVRECLRAVAWERAVADVRPFLEPGADAALLAPENLARVLTILD